ncbi:MAG: Rieske 2Fe-2S domain-containing protein [Cyanobacteria bacterium J06597_1]
MTQRPLDDLPTPNPTTETPSFNFFHQWYPVSPIEDLDPTRPTAVTVLGIRFVIWKPKNATEFRIFRDRCPHRLAPLSQGRIDESGTLMCSYHGWQFDPNGTCTTIPQSDNPELLEKQPENYCAIAYPSQQANDLLWLWPDTDTADLAQSTPLPLSPQIDASKGFVWSSMVRDLEYDWQTLVENVADPSHVPFSHHGIQGNRNKARPIPMEITSSTPTEINVKTAGTITFRPPCLMDYAIQFGDKKLGLIVYCIPVTPGKSRIVAQFARNFAHRLHRFTPRWWEHIKTRNAVLDGDMALLHFQERELTQSADLSPSWKESYTMPASADRLVIEFRRWFDRHCQGQLPWSEVGLSPNYDPPLTDDRTILDRYHQHTIHCSSCRGALKAIQNWQLALVALAILLTIITALLPDAARLPYGLPLAAFTLISLSISATLKFWLEPQFLYVPYIHADR